jgi:replicative DNA helicase
LAGSENKNYENRNLEVTAISRGLKHLARELNIPILAAAQLNRAVEARASKRPVLSDLRESGSLEQDAYVVIFLYETEDKNVIAVDVAKHRNGPTGECQMKIHRPTVKFENLYRSIA